MSDLRDTPISIVHVMHHDISPFFCYLHVGQCAVSGIYQSDHIWRCGLLGSFAGWCFATLFATSSLHVLRCLRIRAICIVMRL